MKENKKKICQKIYHIYLLIVLREKTLNFTWRLETGERIERVRLKVRVCENERKMNFWWSCWVLYYVFTEGITEEILNIIIFNYSVGDSLGNSHWNFHFALKFSKNPLEFSRFIRDSVGKNINSIHSQRCIN